MGEDGSGDAERAGSFGGMLVAQRLVRQPQRFVEPAAARGGVGPADEQGRGLRSGRTGRGEKLVSQLGRRAERLVAGSQQRSGHLGALSAGRHQGLAHRQHGATAP